MLNACNQSQDVARCDGSAGFCRNRCFWFLLKQQPVFGSREFHGDHDSIRSDGVSDDCANFTNHNCVVDETGAGIRATNNVCDEIAMIGILAPADSRREKLMRWSMTSYSKARQDAKIVIAT